MFSYDKLISLCESTGCEYSLTAELKDYTSFKIGGKADIMIFPNSISVLSELVAFIRERELPLLVIGKGSNLLISDEGFRGVVINTSHLDSLELLDDTTIKCSCGVSLARLCRFALENSLTGLEFAYGIPGSAGGAAYMNAGAYGGQMSDVLVECEHILPDGSLDSFSGDELDLGYRHSVYSDSDFVIVSLTLRLQKGNNDEIRAKMDDLIQRRKDKQPLEYPSAGSTFKRPEGYFAGALIEQCGLKGCRIGGAEVSEKHAGFLINAGSATCNDVLALIKHCQDTVFKATGVELEPEVKII